jgi:hypothetical protein
MATKKKYLDRRQLDALLLSTPEARIAYEEARRSLQRQRGRKEKPGGPGRKT